MALSLSLAGPLMEEVVILGGGVAGLSCLNAFLDQGIDPLLIDAGVIGSPKMCGEFLSQQAVMHLERWNIGSIQQIDTISLSCEKMLLQIDNVAGAMSRSEVEKQLASRAKSIGGRILENSRVALERNLITFLDGQTIQAKQLVIATGKVLPQQPSTEHRYIGLKAHFRHDQLTPMLQMHLFAGGYFGIVPISPEESNIACLVKRDKLPLALQLMNKELAWFRAPVGDFGFKKLPNWPNCYFIGDALASFPPAAGSGFHHAITSSLQVVQYVRKNDPEGYQNEMKNRIKAKMRRALILHRVMLSPQVAKMAIRFIKHRPTLLTTILQQLHLSRS